ncbi:MAG: hypothetical protein FWG72_00150 [Oscillospiraceae bacterium]|nr:hypothetical protein [Oscillospiraceae bacterium]
MITPYLRFEGNCEMDNISAFLQHLVDMEKKPAYIDMSREVLEAFREGVGNQPPSSEAIDSFVRSRWSGYVSRDRATYQILNDYSDFCENEHPAFTAAFREHIRETFEGEARKAVRKYKNAIVYIPENTQIESVFRGGLTNDEFVKAFRSLQEVLFSIYDSIERSSPFDWGWSDWKGLTAEGLNHNRVMMVLAALVDSGRLDCDCLCVEKKSLGKHGICRPMANTRLMFNKFIDKGFHISGIDDKKSPVFTVSFPKIPNLMAVLYAYFKSSEKARQILSYRFVQDPAAQNRETFFLAKTDGQSKELREIYDWLYDEAMRHGFTPYGSEKMGCYVYKKGKEEWLLLGDGSSYHEDEFLHSVKYKMAAKVRFDRVFQTHSDEIETLMKRFPDSFGRWWTQCFKCRTGADSCKYHIRFTTGSRSYCAKHHHLYFHDPDFNDVKELCELYKLENNIKPS